MLGLFTISYGLGVCGRSHFGIVAEKKLRVERNCKPDQFSELQKWRISPETALLPSKQYNAAGLIASQWLSKCSEWASL
jgi:hypothetical protein